MTDKIDGRIAEITGQTDHRPSPLPKMPWVMAMKEEDLLYIHWPVPVERLRPLVPTELEIETYEGQAWLTMIPFQMTQLHLRGLPPIPGLSTVPQVELRTYVRMKEQSGVTFLSLDANHPLITWVAGNIFQLPYLNAKVELTKRKNSIYFQCRRPASDTTPAAEFVGSYWPVGRPSQAKPGSLEYFLVERYVLFVKGLGNLIYWGAVHHLPWKIQSVEVEIETNTIPAAAGIELPETNPLLYYAAGRNVITWPVLPFFT